jgi:hypothetical protein
MPAALTIILQLLAAAPGAISSLEADYTAIKSLFAPQTQTAIEAIIATLNAKVLADADALNAAAKAAEAS